MESLNNNTENFESFKKRIAEIFESEGDSGRVMAEIKKWHDNKYEQTDMAGGTIEQRVVFQIELAELYLIIGKNSSAFDTLGDAWDQANQEGLADLVAKITEMMNNVP